MNSGYIGSICYFVSLSVLSHCLASAYDMDLKWVWWEANWCHFPIRLGLDLLLWYTKWECRLNDFLEKPHGNEVVLGEKDFRFIWQTYHKWLSFWDVYVPFMVTHNKLYLGLHSAQWRLNGLQILLHMYPAYPLSKPPW